MSVPYRPFLARLVRRERLSTSFVRITLAGPDLQHCSPVLLDQRVKLALGAGSEKLVNDPNWYPNWLAMPDDERPALRTYTLSAVRPERSEVDIDVVLHAPVSGPASRFAAAAEPGSTLVLIAGDSRFDGHDTIGVAWNPGDATDVLLVADETALPAVVNIASTFGPELTGRVLVEVPHADDVRELSVPAGVEVRWCVRADGESVLGLLSFPRHSPEPEPSDSDPGDLLWDEGEPARWYGWVAGEAGLVRQVRRAAKQAGRDPRQASFMGYWKRGQVSA